MYRSFSDRVFGGVCGGFAADLGINPWLLRLLLVLLLIPSSGAIVLLYIALWWLIPQESLIVPRKTPVLRVLLVVAVIVVMLGAWIAAQSGQLDGPTGESLFLPLALLILSITYLLRQVTP